VPAGLQVTERSSVTSRLKRIAAFVAIVWGVAATFIGFEIVATSAFDFVAANPLSDRFVTANLRASRSCVVEPELASQDAGQRTMPGRDGAFMLGVLVGRHAAFAPYATSNPGVIAPLVAAVEQAATELGIATPTPFAPRQVANANTEFGAWLEADDNRTTRQIAARYSPQACHAYKLGAVWGYREVMRLSLPSDTTAFGVEIRYYAGQIPVPEELWRSMLRPSALAAGSDELEAEGNAVTAAVLSFLSK
jgi:hypothetical protein